MRDLMKETVQLIRLFILMGHRSQSITDLLILLFKRKAERERGGVKERGCLAGLWRDLPPNLCILGLY